MIVNPDLGRVSPDVVRKGVKEMLSVRTEGEVTFVRINYSSLDLIQCCPRKAQYVLYEGRKAKTEATALTYGSAIHKGLEIFYSHPYRERTMPDDFLAHAELIPAGVTPPTEHFLYEAVRKFCETGDSLRVLPNSDKHSLSGGVWVLYNYFKTYLDDPYVVYCDESGPVTERQFTLPIVTEGPVRVDLFGQIDVVLRNEHNGVILPADHKTTSRLGDDFFNRIKPNHQYTAYLLGAQKVLGLTTDAFMANALEVKPKPGLTKTGKQSMAGPPQFARQVTKRSPEDMSEFKDVLLEAVGNYLRWTSAGKFPLGPVSSCSMYRKCQFMEVCSSPSSIRGNILQSSFTTPEELNAITQ